jgi:hypothetical protein
MSDKIILEYGVKYDELDKAYTEIEKDLKGIEKASEKSMGELEKDSKSSAKAINQNTKEVKTLSGEMKNLASNLPFASQIKQIQDFGSAVLNTGNAAGKSSSMFKVLKVAIASTGIGALVVVIGSLIAYFKRTDEGGTRLAGIMAGLGAVLDRVTGIFVGLGEKVFNMFTSFENFKQGIKDLGEVIKENLINRLKAPLVIFDALGAAFKEFKENGINGNFGPAIKLATDGLVQLGTGVANITDKVGDFAEEARKAAAAAADWTQREDALSDKIRENSKLLSANEKEIVRLFVASKNKQISDEESLAMLEKASKLEKENLSIVLNNEKQKLKLIEERNQRERESINQNQKALAESLRNEKLTYSERQKILSQLLSINDDLAQEEVDIINRINQLQGDSFRLQERINNNIDAKKEEIFQNELKRIATLETAEENAAKERLLNGTINAEKYEEEIFDIKLKGLEAQKQLLIDSGRETIEIDKAILDLRLAQAQKEQKALADAVKTEADARKKALDELIKVEEEKRKEARKKQEEEEKAHQERMKYILSSGIDIATDLVNGFYANSQDKRKIEEQAEFDALSKQTEERTAALQQQLDNGIITQEQFNARKKALDEKQRQEEANIKRKSFEADKRAQLISVAINTAAAIAKTLATLGVPAGLAGAAIAAAAGAAQAAIISSKPVPKFKDGVIDFKGKGTGTSDSNLAMISRGESVMTANETTTHKPLLQSIRDNTVDDFINKSYVMPALQSLQARENRARADRQSKKEAKLDSLLQKLDFDTSNLERVVKNNGNVGIKNTKQLAKDIARENQINSNWYK